MTKTHRKRSFATHLEDMAETLRHLDKSSWSDRDIRISERTQWDFKQMARAVRASNPGDNPPRQIEINRLRSAKRPSRAKVKRPKPAGLFVPGTMRRATGIVFHGRLGPAAASQQPTASQQYSARVKQRDGESLTALVDRLAREG